MKKIDNFTSKWHEQWAENIDAGVYNPGETYMEMGNIFGFLGNKKEGVYCLNKAINLFEKDISEFEEDKKIAESQSNQYGLKHANRLILENIWDQQLSKMSIMYHTDNEPLAKFNLDKIMSNIEKFYFDLRGLGNEIVHPLRRINELKEKGVSNEFHPNFIFNTARDGVPSFVEYYSGTEGIKYENYIKNPISPELLAETSEVMDNYTNQKNIKYGSEKFDKNERIIFEKSYSEIALKIYRDYSKRYLENILL